MRLFVAAELAGPAKEEVLSVHERLVAAVSRQGVRFVRPEKLHVTLAFLGQVEESEVEPLKEALNRLGGSGAIGLETSGLGCFPEMRRPKVIWVGLAGETGRLGDLASKIAAAAKPYAPEMDEKPFSAHVTLARINPGSRDIGRMLIRFDPPPRPAALPVDSFVLMLSKPDGTYEVLHRVSVTHTG